MIINLYHYYFNIFQITSFITVEHIHEHPKKKTQMEVQMSDEDLYLTFDPTNSGVHLTFDPLSEFKILLFKRFLFRRY